MTRTITQVARLTTATEDVCAVEKCRESVQDDSDEAAHEESWSSDLRWWPRADEAAGLEKQEGELQGAQIKYLLETQKTEGGQAIVS